eukprot:COSAG03_NODE_384_length_8325_cov_50.332726_7_plen_69_part_00
MRDRPPVEGRRVAYACWQRTTTPSGPTQSTAAKNNASGAPPPHEHQAPTSPAARRDASFGRGAGGGAA